MISFITSYRSLSMDYSSTKRRQKLAQARKPAIALTKSIAVCSPFTTSTSSFDSTSRLSTQAQTQSPHESFFLVMARFSRLFTLFAFRESLIKINARLIGIGKEFSSTNSSTKFQSQAHPSLCSQIRHLFSALIMGDLWV